MAATFVPAKKAIVASSVRHELLRLPTLKTSREEAIFLGLTVSSSRCLGRGMPCLNAKRRRPFAAEIFRCVVARFGEPFRVVASFFQAGSLRAFTGSTNCVASSLRASWISSSSPKEAALPAPLTPESLLDGL